MQNDVRISIPAEQVAVILHWLATSDSRASAFFLAQIEQSVQEERAVTEALLAPTVEKMYNLARTLPPGFQCFRVLAWLSTHEKGERAHGK